MSQLMDKLKHPMMISKKQPIQVRDDEEMVVSCKIEFEFPRNGLWNFVLDTTQSRIRYSKISKCFYSAQARIALSTMLFASSVATPS